MRSSAWNLLTRCERKKRSERLSTSNWPPSHNLIVKDRLQKVRKRNQNLNNLSPNSPLLNIRLLLHKNHRIRHPNNPAQLLRRGLQEIPTRIRQGRILHQPIKWKTFPTFSVLPINRSHRLSHPFLQRSTINLVSSLWVPKTLQSPTSLTFSGLQAQQQPPRRQPLKRQPPRLLLRFLFLWSRRRMRPRSELSTSYSVSGHDASIIIRTIYSKRTNLCLRIAKKKRKVVGSPLF